MPWVPEDLPRVVWLEAGEVDVILGRARDVCAYHGLPKTLPLTPRELALLAGQLRRCAEFGGKPPQTLPPEHVEALAAVKRIFPGALVDDLDETLLPSEKPKERYRNPYNRRWKRGRRRR